MFYKSIGQNIWGFLVGEIKHEACLVWVLFIIGRTLDRVLQTDRGDAGIVHLEARVPHPTPEA